MYGIAENLSKGSKKSKKGIMVERAVGKVDLNSDRARHLKEESPHVIVGTPKTVSALLEHNLLKLKGLKVHLVLLSQTWLPISSQL